VFFVRCSEFDIRCSAFDETDPSESDRSIETDRVMMTTDLSHEDGDDGRQTDLSLEIHEDGDQMDDLVSTMTHLMILI
jgi:hypothetical protein